MNTEISARISSKRSNLYNLEPIALGTGYVESLTSYLGRIANAHLVSIRTLGIKYLNLELKSSQYTLNGNRSITPDLVTRTETETMVSGLSRLTMLPLMHIVAQHDLFKNFRAWCPLCYHEWANTKRPIYDPLLWSLNVVSHCPVHKQPLNCICPNPECHKQIRKYGLPGICPYCQQSLGVTSNINCYDMNDNKNDKWVSWVNENCMGLLKSSSQINTEDWTFDKNLRVCLKDVLPDELEIAAFARKIGIHPQRMFQFCNGHDRPSLEILLKISYNLGQSLEKMLLSKKDGGFNRKRKSGTPYGSAEIQQKLIEILKANKDVPSTVVQLAKQVGCARSTLRKYVPNVNQLLDEARKKTDPDYSKKTSNRPLKLSKTEINKTLLLELNSEEPKCLAEIARNLGRHPTTIKWHFPELCKQIVNRYREHRLEKIEQLTEEQKRINPLQKNEQSQQGKSGTTSRKLKITKETMEYELLSSLAITPPVPLEHIVKSLEISRNNLRNHFPDLCKQVVTRYKTYDVQQRKLFLDRLHAQLQHHLESHEVPLPLEKIASIYNVNTRHYYKHFPELAHRVSKLYSEYRKETSSQDHLLLNRSNIDYPDIEQILEQALTAKIPLSLAQISKDSGYSIKMLKKFPKHYAQIRKRYSDYRTKKRMGHS